MAGPGVPGFYCPTCGRRYFAPGYCPNDSYPVMPVPLPSHRCPSCGTQYYGPGVCPKDSTAVVPLAGGYYCPLCGMQYGSPGFCWRDSAAVLPIPVPAAPPPQVVSSVRKFCPTCGERYGADARVCPKDGTELKVSSSA